MHNHKILPKSVFRLFTVLKKLFSPFNKFPSVDPILGPEMKSTGEAMGLGDTFAEAYGKAQLGVGEGSFSLFLSFVMCLGNAVRDGPAVYRDNLRFPV